MQQTTILGFQGTEEFDAIPGANTFRIGHRYDTMLSIGDEIVIRDDDLDELRGTAFVADIWTGSLRNMLQEHGDNNHHLKREHSEVRRRDLRSFLIDTYAELGYDVDDTTPFTVIYFMVAEEDASGTEGEVEEVKTEEVKTEDLGVGKVEATGSENAASETQDNTPVGTVFSGTTDETGPATTEATS